MDSKVFVARVPSEPYMEVSSGGTFMNPVVSTFSLRDTGVYKENIQHLYVVVMNKVINYLQLEILGSIPGFSMELSWVNSAEQFTSKILKEVMVDATNRVVTFDFYIRTKVIDDLDVIQMDQYRNILKFRMVYA